MPLLPRATLTALFSEPPFRLAAKAVLRFLPGMVRAKAAGTPRRNHSI
jgi:hypothetical protein